MNQNYICCFFVAGREDSRDRRKRAVNEPSFCFCKRAVQGNSPWDQRFIKVVSYSAGYLLYSASVCTRLIARHPPQFSVVRLMSLLPTQRWSVNRAWLYTCERAPNRLGARGSHKSRVSDRRVNSCWLWTFFVFTLPGMRARRDRRTKCTRVILFCGKLKKKIWCCEEIRNNPSACHQTTAGIQSVYCLMR